MWNIFEYMSNEDRKHIRLVCKRFFEMCIHRKFLRTEQFMCSSDIYSPAEILTTLQRSKREVLQLKFRGARFRRNADLLFEAVSSRIQTLKFVLCFFNKKSLEKILIKCSNLKQLTITSISYQRLLALLDYLEWRKVIKTNLISLEIDLEFNSQVYLINENNFNVGDTFGGQIVGNVDVTFTERIIRIFPNLQYLKINTAFLKTEIPSVLNGIKELGLGRDMYPLAGDNYTDRDKILSLTKYVQIYPFYVPSK